MKTLIAILIVLSACGDDARAPTPDAGVTALDSADAQPLACVGPFAPPEPGCLCADGVVCTTLDQAKHCADVGHCQ